MSLHPNTTVGRVALTVTDFGRSLPYYQERIGLQLLHQAASVAHLGVNNTVLLELTERPSAPPLSGHTGLYHFALLVPSRLELARVIHHLVETETPIGGASDHLVSEALYLSDPDGNGIEIYRDRSRDEWPTQAGRIQMATRPMDVPGVLQTLTGNDPSWNGLHPQTKMGHIHLHVAHLEEAENFYTQAVGFDLITRYGRAAAFVSAGGYHHHLGMNTWAGVGAPPPPPDAVGLDWFEILVPNDETLQATAVRLQQHQVPFNQTEDGLFLHDPSQNPFYIRVIS